MAELVGTVDYNYSCDLSSKILGVMNVNSDKISRFLTFYNGFIKLCPATEEDVKMLYSVAVVLS
jgi:hypothetical protein